MKRYTLVHIPTGILWVGCPFAEKEALEAHIIKHDIAHIPEIAVDRDRNMPVFWFENSIGSTEIINLIDPSSELEIIEIDV